MRKSWVLWKSRYEWKLRRKKILCGKNCCHIFPGNLQKNKREKLKELWMDNWFMKFSIPNNGLMSVCQFSFLKNKKKNIRQ